MKKNILILAGTLIAIYLVLSFLARDDQYHAEKALYKINLQYSALMKDPKAAPDFQVQKIAGEYQKFIEKFPESKLTALAYTLRSRMYAQLRQFDNSIADLEQLIENYTDEEEIMINALLDLAQVYAFQDNKEMLLKTYRRIISDYPTSDKGMQAPLVMAQHFVYVKDTEAAARAYVDAIDHYKALAKQYPESQVEFRAKVLLAGSYVALKNWDKALDIYSDIILRFANPQFWNQDLFLKITRSVNTIAVFEVNDLDYPINLYTQFLQKYPDHPFGHDYQKLIALMEEYKKYQHEQKTVEAGAQSAASQAVQKPDSKIQKDATSPVNPENMDRKESVPALLPAP